jgi:predicted nucleic acid-binding protein
MVRKLLGLRHTWNPRKGFYCPPLLSIYKKLLRERGKELAEIFLSQAYGFHDRVIRLDLELSLLAARTSLEAHLPMADAIIYATAHHHKANLVTSDVHFENLPGVKLI